MAKKDDKTVDATGMRTTDTTPPVPEEPKVVKMKRILHAGQEGPTTADVHPDEVDTWRKHGWHLSTE
jgi:hypothetical protein